jgi:phosphomannomutase
MRKLQIDMQISAASLRIGGMVAAVFGAALILAGAYLSWGSFQARNLLERAGQDARAQVQLIEAEIQRIREALVSESFVTAVEAAAGVPEERALLIAELRELEVRNVLNLVIARDAVETVDLDAFPGGGFAVMEMLLRARAENDVPVQVHFAGTADEYLAVARRLIADDDSSPVVLATFPISVLFNEIQVPDSITGMRLMQASGDTSVELDGFGRNVGADQEILPIRNSLFRLGWHRPTPVRPLGTMQLAGVIGAGVLALLLAALLMRRARSVAEGSSIEDDRVDTDRAASDAPATAPWSAEPSPHLPLPVEAFDTPDTDSGHRPDEVAAHDSELLVPDDDGSQRRPPPPEPELPPLDLDDFDLPDAPTEPSAGAAETAPLTADGEARRGGVMQKNLDASGLGSFLDKDSDEPAADDGKRKPAEAVEDELLFDPDAPDDDHAELNLMLQSLVDEEESGQPETTAAQDDEPAGEHPAEQEISFKLPAASIFRAYDIRGVVGKTLDAEVATAIGLAIGSEARARGLTRICVARDGRLSGAELLAALSQGLAATGVDVIDVGAVPTPVLYYAAQEIGGGSGVMVTGSHNPPDYNGFKSVLGGETLSAEKITALYTRLEQRDLDRGQGQVSEQRIAVQYIERISTDIQLERPLKVVADCGNGIAGSIAPRLLAAIGAEVIPLYAEVDGTFPNHHPDPGDPSTLEDLKLCVRNFNADVGVAFDGDGDRLGVVAPGGEIIYPDRLMMLFARDVLSRVPGAPIIYDVKCSTLLAGEIEKAGGKPIMARTGHSFIKEQLKRDQAPFAGEMSGHFFFKERWFGFDDGIYAAARLLEILAADSRSPAEILAELPKAESTPELKVEMKEGEPHPFVEKFQSQASFEGATIHTLDGVRAEFEDGFGLLRASNTTPVLVLRFEGTDKAALTRIQQQFRKAMLAIEPGLKLPF